MVQRLATAWIIANNCLSGNEDSMREKPGNPSLCLCLHTLPNFQEIYHLFLVEAN